MNRIALLIVTLGFIGVLSGCAYLQEFSGDQVQFNEEFEIFTLQYAGLWYEHARTPNAFQDNTIERDGVQYGPCFNTTAEYGFISFFKLSVLNRCDRESESGEIYKESIDGTASVIPNSQGRKLNVAFGPKFAQFLQQLFLGANYWIYCIGPLTSEGLYNWAVVSGQKKDFIFILTREKFISDELQTEILDCARGENLPVDELVYRQR